MAVVLDPTPCLQNLPPPLKWAGGKRWLVRHLLDYWAGNEQRRLAEPFAGGLAITLGLLPRKALLNDANPHLISFYRWLQRGLDIRPRRASHMPIPYLYSADPGSIRRRNR